MLCHIESLSETKGFFILIKIKKKEKHVLQRKHPCIF